MKELMFEETERTNNGKRIARTKNIVRWVNVFQNMGIRESVQTALFEESDEVEFRLCMSLLIEKVH